MLRNFKSWLLLSLARDHTLSIAIFIQLIIFHQHPPNNERAASDPFSHFFNPRVFCLVTRLEFYPFVHANENERIL